MPRRARVVLCTGAGDVLGALPPIDVATPWWPDVEPVVAAARRDHGLDVLVLRLLDASAPPATMGGDVTYLAELVGGELPVLEPVDVDVADDPHRAVYARPGGLRSILEWAATQVPLAGLPEQVKTWNLSSVVRLPTDDGLVWCKSVPPFLAHEGAIIGMVGGDLAPRLLGRDASTGTALLAHVPGDDQWDAPLDRLLAMVERLVALQAAWADRVPELVAAGLPDWRHDALASKLAALLARGDVPSTPAADALVAGLPDRLAALAACGLPETLVHGDFHPGNWRWDDRSLVLLDWGDSGVGHPLLDATAFLPRVADDLRPTVEAAWVDAWRQALPASDPRTALDLVLPVAALRQALIYRTFLDGIEATEHRYHEDDVPAWIERAATVDAAVHGTGGSPPA